MGRQSKRKLVRPLGGGIRGFAVVDEALIDQGESLEHSIRFTVSLTEDNQVVYKIPSGGADVVIATLVGKIKATFDTVQGSLDATAFASWLPAMIKKHGDGVTLRQGGGVYFVPRTAMAEWLDVLEVVRDKTEHAVYEVPAMESDEAVDAILDAVVAEAETEVLRMEEELLAGGLGRRALKSREGKVDALRSKLERYASLLDTKMPQIGSTLGKLKTDIAAAALADLDLPGMGG